MRATDSGYAVSVPFRGYVVVIYNGYVVKVSGLDVVSVPFRGYVVVIGEKGKDTMFSNYGFRPLSGLCSSN